ncbi:MAG: tipN, partial [Asticcacaulis sp.]
PDPNRTDPTRPDPVRSEPTRSAPARPEPVADPAPRQQRLRMTPVEATPQEPEPPAEGWSWRDLLNGLEGRAEDRAAAARDPGRDAPRETLEADPRFLNDISSMGIDPHALLNRARVEDCVELILDGDDDGARATVRRVAPAAIRRLARRMMTDRTLRDQAEAFIQGNERTLEAVLRVDTTGERLRQLLISDAGRIFLLVDTALSDLA